MRNDNFDRIAHAFRRTSAPATTAIILFCALMFVVVRIFAPELAGVLAFAPNTVIRTPWTLLTYPLVSLTSGMDFLFQAIWMWFAGGSLERAWGTKRFVLFAMGATVVSALGLMLGYLLLGITSFAGGLLLPVAAITIAFAMQNPDDQILFMFMIPLKLKYLAVIDVIYVAADYAAARPLMIPFALIGCAAAYLYTKMTLSSGIGLTPMWRGRPVDEDGGKIIRIRPKHAVSRFTLNPKKWYTNYKEKQRLKDFFDKSNYGS